ncbi:S26 family signal peptidase [Enterobacter cloacae complex sp. 288G10]|uniref:S26 family signal peptidase n=1 Tax=Enterobacter cloacae complex sp. 288G10 TaxID=3395859 RepID=UPI003CECB212
MPVAALPADRLGRPLPSLQLCRRLQPGELFLLSATNPASFDSRYFDRGAAARRDRRCASDLAGDTSMMAADSLHFARAPLIVPSGIVCTSPCRRACSAGAFAPHFALPWRSRPTCRRLASNAPGLRPLCVLAGGLAAGAAAPPGRRVPERERGAKAEGKRKRFQALCARNDLHVGVARHGAASPPCRVGREARADAGMSACFARSDTPELADAP